MNLKTTKVDILITDTLLSPQQSRSYFSVQNIDGTNNAFLVFGGEAAVVDNGILLGPGEFYDVVVKNDQEVRAIAVGGTVGLILNQGQ